MNLTTSPELLDEWTTPQLREGLRGGINVLYRTRQALIDNPMLSEDYKFLTKATSLISMAAIFRTKIAEREREKQAKIAHLKKTITDANQTIADAQEQLNGLSNN